MALQMRNKRNIEFSMASMSDLVFLLLIFFMLTSTLVSPNAIKLLLPNSSSQTMSTQNVIVYINEHYEYFVETTPVEEQEIQAVLDQKLAIQPADAVVTVRADRTVPIQYVVNIIDAVNKINAAKNTKYKVILATKPNSQTQ